MRQILIKDAFIVTMNHDKDVYEKGSILIEEDKIKAVGVIEDKDLLPNCEIIDAKDRIIIPGLINTHTHTSQQLGRGLADDVDLLIWLRERVWPYESNLTAEDSYISTLLCCCEQIRAGVTAFAEAGGQFVESMAKGVSEAGIRANLCKSVMDTGIGLPPTWQKTTEEEIDKQVELFHQFHNTADGRIKSWFNIRTIFNATDELLLRTKELADQYKTGIHMHVAEIEDEINFVKEQKGATTVTHLNNLGILDKNLLAVHTVWLSDEEVEMFRDKQVKVSHNPAAAMRVLGFAKVPRMLREGICVSIGTDGAPCNNRMNMVDEMWLTSLIHKGWRLDPQVVKAQDVLTMATINGAKAMLIDDITGSLEVGKKADLVIINPNTANMLPLHDTVANLVSSMNTVNIESTMCDGKWIMKDKMILSLKEDEIIREARERAEALTKRAGIVLPKRMNHCLF